MSYQDTFQETFASFGPFGQVDYAPHNKGVTPVFFIESVLNRAASEKEGRAIYLDLERVRIQVAGDQFSAAVHPVDVPIWGQDTAKDRFPDEYERWRRKEHVQINGTPLAKWPLATPSFIKEMEFMSIFSVDDLASVADVHLDRIADGRQWRDRAAAWLRSAKDGAAAAQYAAENARLHEEIGLLHRRLDNLAEGRISSDERGMPAEQRAKISAAMKARHAAKKEH